jgi:plastocyanin
MKRCLLLIIPLLFNSTISYAQCNTPITLNSIPDQSSCGADLVTLAANANVMPEDDLLITSVFDGPLAGGTPKGVELYVVNDINDLSEYGLGSANNGGGTDGEEFTFPFTSATAGQYIYLASDSTQFNNWFGFDADYVTSAVNINGNDAIELFYVSNVIDVFGDINLNGTGQPWDYLDGWAYRNSSTGADGSTFALSSWSFSGPNALDGETLNAIASSPIPSGTFVHNGYSSFNTYTIDVTAASSMDFNFAGDFSGPDPAVNISLGDTLVFNVNSGAHPFWINSVQGTGTSNGVVVTNNGTSSGTITWVPTAAGTYYYNCQFHSGMTNTITVGPPAISYAWDNGVTNGVPFTPTASGDYIVIASDGVGCTDTDTVNIIVNLLPTVNAGLDQAVCEGDLVTVSGAGASSYTWDNGVSDAVAFSSTSTTTYTVTGTDANGCENTDEVIVNVNALPLVDAGADQAVCDGDQATLSGSVATSYTWDNGVSDAVAFTPLSTATYTVTGTDGNGCVNSDQVLVTVNTLPAVSGGLDVSICVGDSVVLNGSGAVSYTWDNGITDGVHFIPLAANTYTVTGTDGNGCENSDQVAITINSLPLVDAGADQTVCAGDSVTVSGSGANSYSWDNGVNDGVAFNATTTATFTLTGTDVNGCENTDDIIVTVTPSPNVVAAAAVDTACVNWENVTLSVSPDGGVFSGNGVTDDRFYPPVAGVGSHVVVYSYTDPTTGCVGTDALTIVVEECTGIVDVIQSNLTIYPNPTSDQITINIKGYNGLVNVEVYDLQGRLLETTTNTIVSLKKHAKGIYVLKVSYGDITDIVRAVRD